MQFIIPDVPAEVKTQIQREQLLAKEAKYQHEIKRTQQANEDESPVTGRSIRSEQNDSKTSRQSWYRRFSRFSDGLDSHLDIANHADRRPTENTVWEAT